MYCKTAINLTKKMNLDPPFLTNLVKLKSTVKIAILFIKTVNLGPSYRISLCVDIGLIILFFLLHFLNIIFPTENRLVKC